MTVLPILALSILLQFIAALLAIRLIRISGVRSAWLFIASALFLMGTRRSVTLFDFLVGNKTSLPNMKAELIALGTSVLMVWGVAGIASIFRALKASQAACAAGEVRWRAYIEKAPLGIFVLDERGRCADLNPAAEALSGYSLEEIRGAKLTLLSAESDKDSVDHFRQVIEQGTAQTEMEGVRKDGSRFWTEVLSVRLPDDQILTFCEDMTTHREMDNLLRAQRDFAIALARTSGLPETLELAIRTAITAADMDGGGIYLVNPENGGFDLACHFGLSEAFVTAVSHMPLDRVRPVMAGGPIYSSGGAPKTTTDELRLKEGLKAVAIVPVLHYGRTIGCLNVASRTLDEVPQHARKALETLAGQIGQAIAEEQAQEKRREQESNLTAFFNSVMDFLFVLDEQGIILRVNPVVIERLGYTESEILGRTVLDLHPPARRDEANATVADMMAGKQRFCEVPLVTKDGHEISVETHVVAGQWNGRPALFGLSRDTTRRKQAEAQLRLQSLVLDQIQDRVTVTDLQGMITYVNQAEVECMGYSRDDLLGRSVTTYGEDASRGATQREIIEETLRAGQWRGEVVNRTADGQEVILDCRTQAVVDERGEKVALCGIATDITARKNMEAALREREQSLSLALETAHLGYWLWTMRDNTVKWFGGHAKLFGITDAEFGGTLDDVQKHVHPDDREMGEKNLRRAVEGNVPFDNTYRVIHPDGSIHWLNSFGRISYDEDGGPSHIFGITRDISQFKFAQEDIEERLAQLTVLLESLQRGVLVEDAEGRVIFANQDYCDLFGAATPESIQGCTRVVRSAAPLFRDSETFGNSVERRLADGVIVSDERLEMTDGRILERTYAPIRRDGRLFGHLWLYRDKTEQVRTELEVRHAKEEWERTFDNVPDLISIIDREHRILRVNRAFAERVGESAESLVGKKCNVCVHGCEAPPEYCPHTLTIADGMEHAVEVHEPLLGGDFFVTTTPLFEENGAFFGSVHVARDMTEIKGMEKSLREKTEYVRRILDSTGAHIAVVDADGTIVEVNAAWREFARANGAAGEENWGVGARYVRACSGDALEDAIAKRAYDGLRAVQAGEIPVFQIDYFCHAPNRKRWFAMKVLPLRDHPGQVLVSHANITDRVLAEQALRESDRKNRAILQAVPDVLFRMRGDGVFLEAGANDPRMLWIPMETFIGKRCADVLPADLAARTMDKIAATLATGKKQVYEYTLPFNDSIRYFEARMVPVEKNEVLSIVRDITDRKRSEQDRERLMSAIEQACETVMITDTEGKIQYVNPAFEQVTGYNREEAIGCNARILKSGLQGPDFYREMWDALSCGKGWTGQIVNRKKDGALFTEEAVISPVRDDSGKTVSYVAVKRDITRETELTHQLQQAQKMESVGRLAGGVAHDFNNMLSVIMGHVEMGKELVDASEPVYENLEEIGKAAERSVGLTRQLLAFARRQVVAPKVIDLNATVSDMLKMLQRLIGENIELAWKPGKAIWPLKMDPGQVDQILANLCVNARDAIGKTGAIAIETGNVDIDADYCAKHLEASPGEYVLLELSDNGCGMEPETLEHLFEPFFTTKERGKGTGLGLATVYGIVKQNNGFIRVSSVLGVGSAFTIHLPRYAGESASAPQRTDAKESALRGHETILLVEDELPILQLCAILLESLGYRVLSAATPAEAMRLAEKHADEIHLLLTDVVMPEMDGQNLAKNLIARYPHFKCLFMSGYTADIIVDHGILPDDVRFLHKPFAKEDLAAKIREVLDA